MEEVTIGKARILHCDCLEYMRGLPDKYFELACCDPPFGIGMHQQIGKKKGEKGNKWSGSDWDSAVPSKSYFDELFRISKNQIIWGGNYFELPPTRCNLVWDKVQRIDMADCEIAWTSFNTSARIFTFARSNLQGFRNPDRFHPCEKPIALYEWLLTNYAKQGDKIFDSHLGSMSSVIAALNLGFEIVGCELDDDYFNAGVARVRQSQQQARMFEPEVVIPKQGVML